MNNLKDNPIARIRAHHGSLVRLLLAMLIGMMLIALLIICNFFVAGRGGKYESSDFMVLWLSGKGLLAGINMYDPQAWELFHLKIAPFY